MFRLFFGSVGCGKTTTAVHLIYKDRRKKKPCYDYHYSNFDCDIASKCSLDGLGTWTFPPHSYISVDEAGIDFNNRNWEKMPKKMIEYFKLHRHYKVDIDWFSQSWDDVDITIRRLVNEVWHLKKIGPFTLCRRIVKNVDIDEKTHQPMDMYKKLKMIRRFLPPPFHERTFFLVFRPFYYRYFDSFTTREIPVVSFGKSQKDNKINSYLSNFLICSKLFSSIGKRVETISKSFRKFFDRCVRQQN